MTATRGVFVDTGVFVAFANKKDDDHKVSFELLERTRKGEFGQPFTSDYVFDELVTTVLVRTHRHEAAVRAGELILGSKERSVEPLVRLVRVDERSFAEAWTRMQAGRFKHLSFTDHTIVSQMNDLKIETLLSFDSGFDGIVTRVS